MVHKVAAANPEMLYGAPQVSNPSPLPYALVMCSPNTAVAVLETC